MKIKKFIYIILSIFVVACNNGCKRELYGNRYFSIKLQPNWKVVRSDSLTYMFEKDTAYLKISFYRETKINNPLLRTPEEYIMSEDGNLLSDFAFSDSNTIYTSKNNIGYIKQSIKQDSVKKNYTVKENISPFVRRFVKINEKNLNLEGIDYLCEFVYGNEVKWLPVKLPNYFNDFNFTIDTTNTYYKKTYFPKSNKFGKAGFIYHSYKNNYTLIVQSNLINGSSPSMSDIKRIIKSIKIR